jgi:proline racemase
VVARVTMRGGAVEGIVFRNVPAFVLARDVAAGDVAVDVAYVARFVLRVTPENLPALIAAGRAVKAASDGTDVVRHPADDRLSGLYGIVFYENAGDGAERNVTIFADGEVDRLPCGSATSARAALRHADGLGDDWANHSIANGTFRARAWRDARRPAHRGRRHRVQDRRAPLHARPAQRPGHRLRPALKAYVMNQSRSLVLMSDS